MDNLERINAQTEMAMLWLSLNGSKTEAERNKINKRIGELNDFLSAKTDKDGVKIKWDRYLRFSEKEIAKMSKKYQKFFKYEQVRAIVYLREDVVFAIRCRKPARYGINIEVYSRDLEIAKKKFIAKLNANDENQRETAKMSLMTEYVEYYLQLNAKKVVESSAKHKLNTYKNHIKPYIEGENVKDVTATKCYELLNRLLDDGKSRTAEDVKSILNQAFLLEIGDNVISKNPLNFVEYEKHERKNGVRLDDETIKKIMSAKELTPYDTTLKVMILTGARPCELKSAKIIKGKWVEIQNAKQPKGKVNFRKIPLTEFSRPIVERMIKNECGVNEKNLSTHFRKKYSEGANRQSADKYVLYDCLHTFASICAESGISKPCVDLWLNHKGGGMTEKVYTHVSDDFQIAEMQKFTLPVK